MSHRIRYILMKGKCEIRTTVKGKQLQKYIENSHNYVEVEDVDNEYQECRKLISEGTVLYKLITEQGDVIYFALNRNWKKERCITAQ